MANSKKPPVAKKAAISTVKKKVAISKKVAAKMVVPTWGTIKTFFRPTDVAHMKRVAGIDLSSCASVSAHAQEIYSRVCTKAGDPTCHGGMPPDKPWSKDRQAKFKAWMKAGAKCPK